MPTDPFQQLTQLLSDTYVLLVRIGWMLFLISLVLAGILWLPIFGPSEARAANGLNTFRAAITGILVILLAIPIATFILSHFLPLPSTVPQIPIATATPTPFSTTPLPTIVIKITPKSTR